MLEPTEKAKLLVKQYIQSRRGMLMKTEFEVKVVWFCKTLQNWKALLISTLEDKQYYEVTYDGDKAKYYLDAYDKVENVEINIEDVYWESHLGG